MIRPGKERGETVKIGIAAYSREQWVRLVAVAVDRVDMEDTWEEWLEVAKQESARLRQAGFEVREMAMDVDALEAYCRRRGLPNNADTRARYLAERLRAEDVNIRIRW
ncbi:MAG: hypothetical protein HY673_12260 [Chloroflexi bacterium]|nr:hypothetical protein [Chloroflexota bacterium]